MKSSSAAERAGGEVGQSSTQALCQAPSRPSRSPASPAPCSAVGEEQPHPRAQQCLHKNGTILHPRGLMLPRHRPHALSRLRHPLAHCRGRTPTLNPGVLSSRIRCCHKQDTHVLFD